MIDYSGILAFCPEYIEGFPFKVVYYLGSVYMVPDWSVHHDPGDEDDGETKTVARYLLEHFARTASL